MPENLLLSTDNGHYYLNDNVSLLHPELAKSLSDPEAKVDDYYRKKLEYLRSKKRLEEAKNATFIELEPSNVEYQLANTPQVVFEVTDACNLSCKYCAYGEMYSGYDKREDKMLSVDKAYRMLDYLAKFWNSSLNVSANRIVYVTFYGGEPLLNMKFIESAVAYVKKLDCPNRFFGFGMTTNAMLLDRYMDFLVENNFKLTISLDGDEANTGYRVDHAGNPAYKRIENNVELLRKKYPDFFETNISFNAVLHNKNSVEDIYRFFKNRYNKVPMIGELNPMGIKEEAKAEFMSTYRNAWESLQQSENYTEVEKGLFLRTGNYQSAVAFLHQRSGFVYRDYNHLLYEPTRKFIPTGTCLPFSKKLFVTVNGKILPCERIGQQYAVGEITDTEIKLDFEEIAAKYNAYYASLNKQCAHCKNSNFCRQCIFNLKGLDKNKPICEGFMNNNELKSYIQTQVEFLASHRDDYTKIMRDVTIE